jgi:hypothetical protein
MRARLTAYAMKSFKDAVRSPYQGSEATYELVREQIRERYGDEAAEDFDPYTDAMPFASWVSQGYMVRKGEKALKSVTFVEVKDEKGGVVKKIRRTVNLFHRHQVEKQ